MFKSFFDRHPFTLLSIAGLLGSVGLCAYGYRAGVFTSFETMRAFIYQTGFWGPMAFVLIQMIQVILPILPGGISCAYGVLLFGAAYGFVYNYVGIVIGSVLAFLLSRRLGKPFIQKIAPSKIYHKYMGWLDNNHWFEKLFALGILLPGAPDDLLCMLAGISGMKLNKFLIILILCKPGALFLYSIGLSGAIEILFTRR
jgi:uncharacterized membrane protein YdjX (TVP38/TMEM64 family)